MTLLSVIVLMYACYCAKLSHKVIVLTLYLTDGHERSLQGGWPIVMALQGVSPQPN